MFRRLSRASFALVMIVAAAVPASAQCWIDRERPTTADQLPVASARVAVARASARAINRILRANGTLAALPDVRLRSTWQVVGHPSAGTGPYGVHFVLWAHGRGGWATGDCALIPEADRLEPSAAIVVQTNSVNSTLTQRPSAVRDEQIQAFIEPEQIGTIGRHAIYRGQWIVLTPTGERPWVPVTMAEYLAFEERRLIKAEAEAARGIAETKASAGRFDEKALAEVYEAMKASNPAEAEKFRTMMAEVKAEAARAAAAAPVITNAYTKDLVDLRALRASLSPAALQAQAREGYTAITPRAPIDRLPLLVKLDPARTWDRANPQRIMMLELHFSGRGAPYDGLMRKAAEALDRTALEALMR